MTKVTLISATAKHYYLDEGVHIIGRCPGSLILLPQDPLFDEFHIQLRITAKGVWLKRLGHIPVRYQRLAKPCDAIDLPKGTEVRLHHGDSFCLLGTKLVHEVKIEYPKPPVQTKKRMEAVMAHFFDHLPDFKDHKKKAAQKSEEQLIKALKKEADSIEANQKRAEAKERAEAKSREEKDAVSAEEDSASESTSKKGRSAGPKTKVSLSGKDSETSTRSAKSKPPTELHYDADEDEVALLQPQLHTGAASTQKKGKRATEPEVIMLESQETDPMDVDEPKAEAVLATTTTTTTTTTTSTANSKKRAASEDEPEETPSSKRRKWTEAKAEEEEHKPSSNGKKPDKGKQKEDPESKPIDLDQPEDMDDINKQIAAFEESERLAKELEEKFNGEAAGRNENASDEGKARGNSNANSHVPPRSTADRSQNKRAGGGDQVDESKAVSNTFFKYLGGPN